MFKKYLLGTTILRAPDGGGNPPPDDPVEDTLDPEDDEGTLDPAGEPDEGDDTGDADDLDAAPADDAPPQRQERQPSRAERRITALDERNKQLAAETARLTRELEEFRRSQRQAPPEDPRVEQERLALMAPHEQAQYIVDKALRRNEQNNQVLQMQIMDQVDRTAFAGKAAGDKLRTRLLPEVERQIADLRAQGRPVPEREVLYTYLVGQRALANREAARPRAQARTTRQQARPANGRGDVAPVRQRRGNSAEDRLGDIEI